MVQRLIITGTSRRMKSMMIRRIHVLFTDSVYI